MSQKDSANYAIVRLAGGAFSVRSLAEGETFHPVVGPVAEAQSLYVEQIGLAARARACAGEFVIWDVGLGAAANTIAALRALAETDTTLRILSFDKTDEPLRFALQHRDELGYFAAYEKPCRDLLDHGCAEFQNGRQRVHWEFFQGDFPAFLERPGNVPPPHVIMFDAFSPARNPAMWTAPLFAALHRVLDPSRPCVMPTYSRSTLLRVTLLLAGFYVGAGHATGEKEETTIAANTRDLIREPLGEDWLRRARRSRSAEPMWEPVYRQQSLAPETWERLRGHPQFAAHPGGPQP